MKAKKPKQKKAIKKVVSPKKLKQKLAKITITECIDKKGKGVLVDAYTSFLNHRKRQHED